MSNDKAKEVFKALPDINEIWITKDGNHHLHPHNGGVKHVREIDPHAEEKEQEEQAKADKIAAKLEKENQERMDKGEADKAKGSKK